MSAPREPQAFLVWARMESRPALEAEVDRRLLQNGAPRRAIWNQVAAEWFRAASENEQAAARAEAKTIHADELLDWEQRVSGGLGSPDDAVQCVLLAFI